MKNSSDMLKACMGHSKPIALHSPPEELIPPTSAPQPDPRNARGAELVHSCQNAVRERRRADEQFSTAFAQLRADWGAYVAATVSKTLSSAGQRGATAVTIDAAWDKIGEKIEQCHESFRGFAATVARNTANDYLDANPPAHPVNVDDIGTDDVCASGSHTSIALQQTLTQKDDVDDFSLVALVVDLLSLEQRRWSTLLGRHSAQSTRRLQSLRGKLIRKIHDLPSNSVVAAAVEAVRTLRQRMELAECCYEVATTANPKKEKTSADMAQEEYQQQKQKKIKMREEWRASAQGACHQVMASLTTLQNSDRDVVKGKCAMCLAEIEANTMNVQAVVRRLMVLAWYLHSAVMCQHNLNENTMTEERISPDAAARRRSDAQQFLDGRERQALDLFYGDFERELKRRNEEYREVLPLSDLEAALLQIFDRRRKGWEARVTRAANWFGCAPDVAGKLVNPANEEILRRRVVRRLWEVMSSVRRDM